MLPTLTTIPPLVTQEQPVIKTVVPENKAYSWNKFTDAPRAYPIDEIILPPPFVKTTVAVDDPMAQNIPGEIMVDRDGKLLIKTVNYTGIVGDKISSYNNFISSTGEIGKILSAHPINLFKGTVVHFSNPQWVKPKISGKNGYKPLYSIEARLRDYTYAATLYVDLTLTDEKGNIMKDEQNKDIIIPKEPLGYIPVMIGSILDNLWGKTQREKLQVA